MLRAVRVWATRILTVAALPAAPFALILFFVSSVRATPELTFIAFGALMIIVVLLAAVTLSVAAFPWEYSLLGMQSRLSRKELRLAISASYTPMKLGRHFRASLPLCVLYVCPGEFFIQVCPLGVVSVAFKNVSFITFPNDWWCEIVHVSPQARSPIMIAKQVGIDLLHYMRTAEGGGNSFMSVKKQ